MSRREQVETDNDEKSLGWNQSSGVDYPNYDDAESKEEMWDTKSLKGKDTNIFIRFKYSELVCCAGLK